MQAKIDNYAAFLESAEKALIAVTPPAWKHRNTLQTHITNLPEGAIKAHKVPSWQLTQVLLDNIANPKLKCRASALFQEILYNEAPPTPRIDVSAEPMEVNDDGDDDDEPVLVEDNDDYELPQFSRSFDPDTIPADLFETPCLPKRRRLREKTTVTLPVAPESIPIHSGSSLDGSDTLSRSEKKRLAKAKRAAEARANAALAHAAKTQKK